MQAVYNTTRSRFQNAQHTLLHKATTRDRNWNSKNNRRSRRLKTEVDSSCAALPISGPCSVTTSRFCLVVTFLLLLLSSTRLLQQLGLFHVRSGTERESGFACRSFFIHSDSLYVPLILQSALEAWPRAPFEQLASFLLFCSIPVQILAQLHKCPTSFVA